MTCWLKLPLASVALVILAAACALPACSSSNPITVPGDDAGGTSNDAGTSGSGADTGTGPTDSGSSKKTSDAGGKSGGDSSVACTIPPDWSINSQGPMCDACELKNCCPSINNCENDTGCVAIYNCQNVCYSGDAGSDDAAAGDASEDASAPSSADNCAAACVTGSGASTASQNLFTAQDNCVNGTTCGSISVCN